MAKKYVGSVTLAAFMEIIKTELGKKMTVRDVLTSLDSYTAATDADKLVAAAAINALKEQIASFGTSGKVNDSDKLDGHDSAEFLLKTELLADKGDFDTDAANQTATDKGISAQVAYQILAMIKAIDANGDGKADTAANAEQLGGQAPDYYAKAADLTGVVKVGADGKIAEDYLPSYVDDVVDVYYDETAGKIYSDAGKANEITPETGKIYIDITGGNNKCYRWSGSAFVKITSGDEMVELTDTEIQTMWDTALAAAVYDA